MKAVVELTALGALLFVIIASPGQATQRMEQLDETYLIGYLTWKDGKGGITWSNAPSGEDNVSPGNDLKDHFDEFVSDPLPRTAYINVSRVIQVHLLLAMSSAPNIRLELTAGSGFLTGGTGSNGVINFCPSFAPKCTDQAVQPRAAGYLTDSYGMQAELESIDKAATIRLRVVHETNGNPTTGNDVLRYGLDGDHRSVIRIPLFSPDEVLFRIPKYQSGPSAQAPTGSLDGVSVPGPVAEILRKIPPVGLPLAGLPLAVAWPRRPRRALVLIALLVTGAMAGCTSKARPEPTALASPDGFGGRVDSYLIADHENETGLSNATYGAVLGVVVDPDELPVDHAFVSLEGIPRSQETDHRGRFQFPAVKPGNFRLHVDREGFRVSETIIRTEPATVTKLVVVLEFLDPSAVDRRPHRHDYWNVDGTPVESMVIFEGYTNALYLPEGTLIPPGTADIEVNFTWSGTARTAMFNAVTAHDPGNTTYMYHRASGVPFHLRTTWEMTDPGHSRYSFWGELSINAAGYSGCAITDYFLLPVIPKECQPHLRITVHKGVVPLEPAHPDRWAGGNVVSVFSNETAKLSRQCYRGIAGVPACPLHPDSASQAVNCPPQAAFHYRVCDEFLLTDQAYNTTWQPRGFVPFEGRWLDVRLKANRDLPGTAPGTAPWRLSFHTAESSNYGTCDPMARSGSAQDPTIMVYFVRNGTRPAGPPTPVGEREWAWRIPLEKDWADPPYARRSNWCFFVAPQDQNTALADDASSANGSNPAWTPVEFKLTVEVHK